MTNIKKDNDNIVSYLLLTIFTLSGVSALIYQVCWQRLLFRSFGIDIQSITTIVSVFMLGLGIGATIGGRLADKYPKKIIMLFSLVELFIGLFGVSSSTLIEYTTNYFLLAPAYLIGIANFLLLLIPTVLMGSTLPMLTFHLNLHYKNIGESIGKLYFSNTMGAASGSLLTAFYIFDYFTITTTIYIAVALNILVSFIAFFIGKNNE